MPAIDMERYLVVRIFSLYIYILKYFMIKFNILLILLGYLQITL
jgi:hypothetical protein